MKSKKIKSNKGITLIALIATIIILLILAGISISYLLGYNGLFSFVNSTEESTSVAEEREQLEVAIKDTKSGDYLDGRAGGITVEGLQASLDDIVGEGKTVVTSTNGGKIEVSETTKAMDVVFVIDLSGSMNYGTSTTNFVTNSADTRMYAVVSALNESIKTLAQNERNRVSVVTFETSSSVKTELTPLTKENQEKEYFKYTKDRWSNYGELTCNIGRGWKKDVEGGTYTQSGVKSAYDVLNNKDNGSSTVYRENIPVIIMITDGEPTYGDSDYDNVNTRSYNTGSGSSTSGKLGYYNVMTAQYYKEMLNKKYNNSAYFYTICMGIDSNFIRALLDPTEENINNCRYSRGEAGDLYDYLTSDRYYTYEESYANGSWVNQNMDSSELIQNIQQAIEEVIYAEGIQVWFEDSNRAYTVNQDETISDNYTIIEERPVQNTTSGDK